MLNSCSSKAGPASGAQVVGLMLLLLFDLKEVLQLRIEIFILPSAKVDSLNKLQ
jgi:hypothetical protein